MASELDSTPLGLEAAFAIRGVGVPPLLRPAAAVCGAIVSPSAAANVGPPLVWLTPEPHAAQNFAVSETAEPHCEQYMGAEFYHCSRRLVIIHSYRGNGSTWTAVPYASTSVTPFITSVAS